MGGWEATVKGVGCWVLGCCEGLLGVAWRGVVWVGEGVRVLWG